MSVCQQIISIQNQSDLQNERRCDKNEWGGGGDKGFYQVVYKEKSKTINANLGKRYSFLHYQG